MTNDSTLVKALSWVTDVDIPAAKASVEELRRQHPQLSREKLAKKAFSKALWKATATGIATGMAGNPWAAAPAAGSGAEEPGVQSVEESGV